MVKGKSVDGCTLDALDEYCPAIAEKVNGDISKLDWQNDVPNCQDYNGFIEFLRNGECCK